MATPVLHWAGDAGVGFAEVRLRALGADRSLCVIAFEPARMAVRVIAVSVRWNERLQRVFRLRRAMTFGLSRSLVS
jgi:hypothetical protein